MQINQAFSQRRKMMRNALQPLYSSAASEAALVASKLRPDARAQDLSVQQFADVHWELHRTVVAAARGEEGGDDSGGEAAEEEGAGESASAAAASPAATL